jgi:hypothetical protein
VYGEVVSGMGEALVGNYPGRSVVAHASQAYVCSNHVLYDSSDSLIAVFVDQCVMGLGLTLPLVFTTHNGTGAVVSFILCRALSFSVSDSGQHHSTILSLPSKPVVIQVPGVDVTGGLPLLIARSDANGEDLPDLAAAGLYDR